MLRRRLLARLSNQPEENRAPGVSERAEFHLLVDPAARDGSFQLTEIEGTQFKNIDPIPVCYGFLKIIIWESFGDEKCYINQVFLLADNPMHSSSDLPAHKETIIRERSSSVSAGRTSEKSDGRPRYFRDDGRTVSS